MSVRNHVGDVRKRLRDLPDESVHSIVTSPPNFGLRDYGCDGQIGLEATPDAYVAELVAVFCEARRVLRADGTFWLNLGDSYSNQGKWGGATGGKATKANHGANGSRDKREYGLPFKQRLMIPARVALALQSDGWWLRDEIIWHKPNPMPVSVTDRTTPAHEMLYMFSKSARYHYDMEAVKESSVKGASGSNFDTGKTATHQLGRSSNKERVEDGMRQPRSVWSIATRPFKGAHFATFPPDLIRPCILAGCPKGGTVLDPFFGAGTTGLVAQQLGRSAIGIELNPTYAAIARERIGLPSPLDRILRWNAAVAAYRIAA
jgi:DNA modification methylase